MINPGDILQQDSRPISMICIQHLGSDSGYELVERECWLAWMGMNSCIEVDWIHGWEHGAQTGDCERADVGGRSLMMVSVSGHGGIVTEVELNRKEACHMSKVCLAGCVEWWRECRRREEYEIQACSFDW